MRLLPLVVCFSLLATGASPVVAQERSSGRIAFVSTRTPDGNADIFTSDFGGERVVNLTNDPAPDRSPSWSPDGRSVVFASRRGSNWDLYTMNANGGDLSRLTTDPGYDGEPAWSPDGSQIAFSSLRDGNLDIYIIDLLDGSVVRLTDDGSADYQPSWSPDGSRVAFTSWRDGNQEVYAVSITTGELQNLSSHPAPDYNPAFAPDGRRLAYLSDRDGPGNLHVVDLANGAQVKAGPINRSLQDPTWTPTGGLVAAGPASLLNRRFNGPQGIVLATAGISTSVAIVSSSHAYAEPAWSVTATAPEEVAAQREPGRLYPVPAVPQDISGYPQGFVGLGDVQSGGRSVIAAAVQPSFQALRRDVIAASGHDFLARLSEATRAVGYSSGTSSYTSWHKSGRAIDTLFDYRANGQQVLYIAPETIAGRLFWRLYLRTVQQDGSQGAPLTRAVFNTATREVLPPPRGYFLDFTALAAQHGWARIAAQERDNFNWRSEPLALEYWHFERRDGLSWYNAMSLVYDDGTLRRLFSEDALLAAGASRTSISRLGLPWIPTPPVQQSGWFERSGRPK